MTITTLNNSVGVLTGAAHGIGAATATTLAEHGFKLAILDADIDALKQIADVLRAQGADVIEFHSDVSNREQMLQIADQVFEHFGKVNFLFNNAAINGIQASAWNIPRDDWEWNLGVNFYGILNGIEAFLPRMIAQEHEGVVMNTTSIGGLITGTSSAYAVAKHAVTRLTEGLYYDLQAEDSKISVALLIPGAINTGIHARWKDNLPDQVASTLEKETYEQQLEGQLMIDAAVQAMGKAPQEVADLVLNAIQTDQFYVYTHPEEIKQMFKFRADDILTANKPSQQAGDVQAMFAQWLENA